jgi:nicotinamidase-related amidase
MVVCHRAPHPRFSERGSWYAAFSENHPHMILRSRRIENLVFFGVSTSGIVLSTLRRAYDPDYYCAVLRDACFDADPEVHRVLTEKVFRAQATVQTVDEFIAEQGNNR